MSHDFWQTLFLTFRLATTVTFLLLVLGLPLAHHFCRARYGLKSVLEALVTLPLILPPTVLGFYLLLLLGMGSPVGRFLDRHFDLRLAFSFPGLVIASMIYSLPFMVQPLKAGFEKLSPSLKEASYTLGRSRWETFFRVTLPNMRPSLLTALVLTFAHTVGEFGVVLMIGGNLPGKTRVISIAIFDAVETLNYSLAHGYAICLVILSFLVLLIVSHLNRRLTRTDLLC